MTEVRTHKEARVFAESVARTLGIATPKGADDKEAYGWFVLQEMAKRITTLEEKNKILSNVLYGKFGVTL